MRHGFLGLQAEGHGAEHRRETSGRCGRICGIAWSTPGNEQNSAIRSVAKRINGVVDLMPVVRPMKMLLI